MKKKQLVVIVLALVAAGAVGAAAYFGTKKSSSPDSKATEQASKSAQAAGAACELLTEDDAKKLLGGEVKKSDVKTSGKEGETEDFTNTFCSYTSSAVSGRTYALKSVSVSASKPLNKKGEENNKASLEALTKAGATKVDGLENSVWEPKSKQLIVYKNGNLVSVTTSSMSGTVQATKPEENPESRPTPGGIDEAKKVIEIILPKL